MVDSKRKLQKEALTGYAEQHHGVTIQKQQDHNHPSVRYCSNQQLVQRGVKMSYTTNRFHQFSQPTLQIFSPLPDASAKHRLLLRG